MARIDLYGFAEVGQRLIVSAQNAVCQPAEVVSDSRLRRKFDDLRVVGDGARAIAGSALGPGAVKIGFGICRV